MIKLSNDRKINALIISLILIFLSPVFLKSQEKKKIQFTGAARSEISNTEISVKDEVEDTVTARKKLGGYALIDLGVNIFPNKNTEIMGMFRINNKLGGFYGGGVNIDVRQLWVKGVIANVVRYQLGDINYKLTPYTFYNHDEDIQLNLPSVFNLQRDILNYETFYIKNTWRQQGATADFGLEFSKFIKEIKFNNFINRINISDFNATSDRFFGGGNIGIQQSNNLYLGLNFVSLFDLIGTSAQKSEFRNNVSSINAEYKISKEKWEASASMETGSSYYSNIADSLFPKINGDFLNSALSFSHKPSGIKFQLGVLYTSPDFRSMGAQSKRINYNSTLSSYDRYTNQQILRSVSLYDMVSDAKIYNRSINNSLMNFNPAYNNVLPFGVATFNRQGLYLKTTIAPKNEYFKISADIYSLTEVKGQGTKLLKSFLYTNANTEINLNKIFKLKRNLKISSGVTIQNTTRNSEIEFEKVNLNSTMVSAGIEYEFYENFDLIGGYFSNNANGNEQMASRNIYTEVTDFNEYKINLSETMVGGGLRYRFSEKIFLSALYQQFDYRDKIQPNLSYGINQFLIVFNMKY
ncbi:MAG: hypothetical protein ACK5D5_00620 [Bacteroidota bacterium]